MLTSKLLQQHGTGAGTNYMAEERTTVKKDLLFTLTNDQRKKSFLFIHSSNYVEIKKIILTPKFNWTVPDEWAKKLINEGLFIKITFKNNKGSFAEQSHLLSSYNNPYLFQPVLTLSQPINIPRDLWEYIIYQNEYPLQVSVELHGSVDHFGFDVMIVYDEV